MLSKLAVKFVVYGVIFVIVMTLYRAIVGPTVVYEGQIIDCVLNKQTSFQRYHYEHFVDARKVRDNATYLVYDGFYIGEYDWLNNRVIIFTYVYDPADFCK